MQCWRISCLLKIKSYRKAYREFLFSPHTRFWSFPLYGPSRNNHEYFSIFFWRVTPEKSTQNCIRYWKRLKNLIFFNTTYTSRNVHDWCCDSMRMQLFFFVFFHATTLVRIHRTTLKRNARTYLVKKCKFTINTFVKFLPLYSSPTWYFDRS